MKRPSATTSKGARAWVCPDSDLQLTCPLLAAGLSDPWWDDGKPREPWTLRISMSGDAVSICVADREAKLVSFTTSASITEGFAAIEAALAGGGLSWRKSKY